ncbi:MAG: Cleavage stimulation factor subunit 3 [Trizodia sp. TS-e1964]|nr:MAG: Cleavage stimulation factor subunit 3 [Trizodia sp. TS-e1964]
MITKSISSPTAPILALLMAETSEEMEFPNSMKELNNAAGNYGDQSINKENSLSYGDNQLALDAVSSTFPQEANGSAHQLLSTSEYKTHSSPRLESSSPPLSKSPPSSTEESTVEQINSDLRPQTLSQPSTSNNSTPTPPLQPSASKKPRTMGGFIIDDDDDDELDGQTSAFKAISNAATDSLKLATSTALQGSPLLSKSYSNAITSQDVSIQNAAVDQESSGVSEHSTTNVLSNLAAIISDATALASDVVPSHSLHVPTPAQPNTSSSSTMSVPKARLPHDRVGILEDRIKEDPRGDTEAWINLISEHQKRNKLDDARNVFERFLKVFPSAGEQWVAYANMELSNNDFYRVEQIFNKSLRAVPNVHFWSLYLDYVRRRNNLITDPSGVARTTISQAYDFVLQNIGIDKDSGKIWQEYVQFIRSGPGNIGGSSWQDQQKMDQLRKTYQRAICIPMSSVTSLWKEYDSFEMGLNKLTGRKFLQEKSPSYMSARSSWFELENITTGLDRFSVPILPPALGFEGNDEYMCQVSLWKKWINWEKNDPMVLKVEDLPAYHSRILYVFKQATMSLRYWPEIWFEAAEFCFQNNLDGDGNEFLTHGLTANPESCLLAFKRGDRLEATSVAEEGDEGLQRRGALVREPYDKLLDSLYDLITKAKTKEGQDVARIEENFATKRNRSPTANGRSIEEDDDIEDADEAARTASKNTQIQVVRDGYAVQVKLLSKMISFSWITLMRAMRRIQGKGKVNDIVGGSRQVFTDARKRGRLTSDVYVASALIEYHCYKDPAATKIFERGMKLFPDDESFALEYLKHLIAINDITNARAVFEMTVSKLAQKPETIPHAKPIYSYFHQYESQYGELAQVNKLEQRMTDLFPEDPKLALFTNRYSVGGFEPTSARPIISQLSQMKARILPSIETPISYHNSPPARAAQIVDSPKRPFQNDESENEGRPRKLLRGQSPLKGAAGRRLDQQKRNRERYDGPEPQGAPWAQQYAPPPPGIPREVMFLLSIIPKPQLYNATRFKADELVRLLRDTQIPTTIQQLRQQQQQQQQQQQHHQGMPSNHGNYSHR